SIVRSVDAQVVTAAARQFRNASILIALGVLALSVLPAIWLIHRSVVKPLQAITQQAREMADGDLSRTLQPVGRSDEIGELNAAFRSMAESQRTVVRQLEAACGGLEGASGDMSALADTMASGAGAASERASSAARTTAEVSTSISSVAASLGEMRDSIRAVANSTGEASSIASEGVEAMDLTAETVQKLGQSSAEISDVLDLINDIAEQVNLLALNATIEAARVGEAGKGFAVVANEVKELATRTSVATEQIAERIGRIRTDTESAVKATTEVRQTIGRVDDISAIIAASVEQQSATSQEISGKVARVSEAAGEIAEVVNDTASDTDVTKQNTEQLTASARDLQTISAELRGLLGRYTVAPADPSTSAPPVDAEARDLVGGRR
ncbi:MAG: methyl-accepting chemotaxis protein, partial [Actinomycetota bacterium]